LPLDAEAAHRVLALFGRRLGLPKVEVAAGIHTILNNRMADEIRLLTVRRGYDPREFALLVLGGAGPLHGGPLARMLGIPRLIVPLAPGVLSAFGLLVSDIEHDNAISFRHSAATTAIADLAEAFDRLDRMGRADMQRDRVDPARIGVRHYADMRYVGQSYELEVELAGALDDAALARLTAGFHEAHQRVYHQHNPEAHVELINLRCVHHAAVPKLRPQPPLPGASWEAAQTGTRSVYLRETGGYVEVPIFRRDRLPIAARRNGPFIVEQIDSTTVIFPGESAVVEPNGNLLVDMPAP
jgi:N-methylhydantoinase A